jgi:hypothetical protein
MNSGICAKLPSACAITFFKVQGNCGICIKNLYTGIRMRQHFSDRINCGICIKTIFYRNCLTTQCTFLETSITGRFNLKSKNELWYLRKNLLFVILAIHPIDISWVDYPYTTSTCDVMCYRHSAAIHIKVVKI